MKSVLLASAATLALATATMAAEVSGEVAVDFTQSNDDKIVAETTVDLALEAAMGTVSVELTEEDGNIVLDGYSVGTTLGAVTLSYGDQGDLMDAFEGKTEAVGGQTLTDLDDEGESLMVSTGAVSLMVGLTDVSEDVTDVAHIQATVGGDLSGVTFAAGFDYNLDSEETTLLGNAAYTHNAITFGLTATYQMDAELMGYEADVTYAKVTAFINGDKDDMVQNIGAGYYGDMNGIGYYAEVAYNIDAEEITPAAGVSFKF